MSFRYETTGAFFEQSVVSGGKRNCSTLAFDGNRHPPPVSRIKNRRQSPSRRQIKVSGASQTTASTMK